LLFLAVFFAVFLAAFLAAFFFLAMGVAPLSYAGGVGEN
jgi:hypothetical protein